MKKPFSFVTLGILAVSVTGCARITSQVVEKPRVDQEFSGNQGYLVGSGGGPAPSRKTTRKILQTDIELPTAQELNPWRIRKPVAPAAPPAGAQVPAVPQEEEVQPFEREGFEEEAQEVSAPVSSRRKVTVKKGDTLEKIAAREYKDARKWRLIYEANRDRLPSPNRIYAGQELVIPELEGESVERAGSGDLK